LNIYPSQEIHICFYQLCVYIGSSCIDFVSSKNGLKFQFINHWIKPFLKPTKPKKPA